MSPFTRRVEDSWTGLHPDFTARPATKNKDVVLTSNQMLAESLRTLARGYSTETGRDTLLRAARVVDGASGETCEQHP